MTPCFAGDDPGGFQPPAASRLIQRFGKPEASTPANDAQLKGKLFKALGKEGVLTSESAASFFDPSTFSRLAGPDGRLTPTEVRSAFGGRHARIPHAAFARGRRAHGVAVDLVRPDRPAHREAASKLADWIVSNHKDGQSLHIIMICTGNSRRSVFGATMGNIAAAYCGLPEIRFHSGGTAPTAINSRSIAALKAIGVAIEPTGNEAPRGEPKTANPIYRIRWGDSSMETTEFSKLYADASNPQQGFAAILVCGEADESCPHVKGASAHFHAVS